MCLPAAGAIFGLIGSAVSAAGSMSAANGQAAQMEYNAKVAEANARSARSQGFYEADQVNDEYNRVSGQQNVRAAKSGIRGVPAAVVVDTAANSYLDQMTKMWNRETEAVGFENKAEDLKMQAANTRKAGGMNAAASLIGGFKGLAGGGGGGSPFSIA
jgi:hypothetical protein